MKFKQYFTLDGMARLPYNLANPLRRTRKL
jgi:hypothetical protein